MTPTLNNVSIDSAQSYLLANTELTLNGYVRSITVYASKTGSITLQV